MSIHIERNGQTIRLNTFVTEDVFSFLEIVFNSQRNRFRKVAVSQLCDGYWVKLDGRGFFIHAKETQVEFTFPMGISANLINEVIDATKNWNHFSETEPTFYVVLEDDTSVCIIFENGLHTEMEYRQKYRKNLTYIREFSIKSNN